MDSSKSRLRGHSTEATNKSAALNGGAAEWRTPGIHPKPLALEPLTHEPSNTMVVRRPLLLFLAAAAAALLGAPLAQAQEDTSTQLLAKNQTGAQLLREQQAGP